VKILNLAAAAALAAWTVLALGRGRFWNERPDAHATAASFDETDVVYAIVPARDEADVLDETLPTLLTQRYAGELHVALVDDHSADGTAQVARAAAARTGRADRLTILTAGALPAGWTGKLNAVNAGVRALLDARGAPDWWLFTDADVAHDSSNLAALVADARARSLDLTSLMVLLHSQRPWERLLVPAFVFFFAMLYPFAWIEDPRRKTAGAAGGCILVSHAALERIGGLARIRGALIDDCSLAAAVKGGGGRIALGLTRRTRSIRPYDDLPGLWAMVKRCAFTQLRHSYWLLSGTVAGMTLIFLVPPIATAIGIGKRARMTAGLGIGSWSIMTALFAPTARLYGRSSLAGLALPFTATLYTAMTCDSAVAHLRRRGGGWKGRTYPATTAGYSSSAFNAQAASSAV